jgi:GNAT superfamily N-acetyltransferase
LISSAYAAIDPAELAHLGSWGERPYSKVLRRVAERADAALVLVAVDGERLLGTVTYVGSHDNEWSEFEEEDAAGIRMLAVAPEAQGRGIARSLVAACLQQARADGKNRVILHTTWWMSAAQNLYQTMGFVQRRHAISRSPNPDTHPASRWRPSSMSFDLQNDPVK